MDSPTYTASAPTATQQTDAETLQNLAREHSDLTASLALLDDAITAVRK
jgi:hypothetical protein